MQGIVCQDCIDSGVADRFYDEVVAIEDSPFYVKAARFDELAFEYYAVDAAGIRHWAERAWDAEVAAMAANRQMQIHEGKCPGELQDWFDQVDMQHDLRRGE